MRQEIRSLTGLRGVAACYVLIYHYCRLQNPDSLAGIALQHGYLAVDLFFSLSGFVMALTYAASFYKSGQLRTYAQFLYKRFSRVYPLYFCMTLATIASGPVTGHLVSLSPAGWLVNFLLLSGWGFFPTVTAAAWSISTELAAYLLFPLLVVITLRSRLPIAAIVGIALMIMEFWIATRPDLSLNEPVMDGFGRKGPLDIYNFGSPYPLLRCLVEFTGGLLAYRLARSGWLTRHLARCFPDAIAILSLGFLAITNSDFAEIFLFALLIASLYADGSFASRLLACPPIYWLGTISYSLYLVHIPLLRQLQPFLALMLQKQAINHAYTYSIGLTLLCSLLAAHITYRLIEKPARNGLLKVAALRRRPIATEPATP